jgi:hypothetical protein
MRKLKIGDVVYPTVPVKAYDRGGILPAGTPVTVVNPSVPTTSRFFETLRSKDKTRVVHYKHYVSPASFVLVTFQLDGMVNRGAVYREQLWLKPVPEIITKRFPATRMGVDMASDYYRNMMSHSKHLSRLRHPYIVKVVKPLTEGEICAAVDPEHADNVVVPVGQYGMVVDTNPGKSVIEVSFPFADDHCYYVRYDQIKRVL